MAKDTEVHKKDGWHIPLRGKGMSGPYSTRDKAREARKKHLAGLRAKDSKHETKAPPMAPDHAPAPAGQEMETA